MTRTMGIIESRLSLTEDRVSSLMSAQRGLNVVEPTSIAAASLPPLPPEYEAAAYSQAATSLAAPPAGATAGGSAEPESDLDLTMPED